MDGILLGLEFDSSDPLVVFGAVAGIIFLGFLGNLVFSRFKLNDTLLLILVGVILGPLLGYLEPTTLQSLSNIVGPLALILILFDGGLALNLRDLVHGLGNATVLGLVSFVATTGLVGLVVATALGIPFTTALILGAILGGTSALVVLPSLEHMNVEKRTGTVLGLESALTDVLVVVVSFTLISIVAAGTAMTTGVGENLTAALDGASGPSFDAQGIASKLLITFAMSLFMGIAAGLVWLVLYPRVREKAFGYMLTLGFMFSLYVFVEWILGDVSSGGGPLAVLAFGIMLGNYDRLGKIAFSLGDEFGRGMKRFQGEISFLVRTFFFIFLGAIVDLSLLRDWWTLAVGVLIFGALGVARYVAVVATTRRVRLAGDDLVLLCMMPRGLAAAVLAAEPAKELIPGTDRFVALAFIILVLSNVLATVAGMALQGGSDGAAPNKPRPTTAPAGPRAPAKSTKAAPKSTKARAAPAKSAPKSPAKATPARKASGAGSIAVTSAPASKAPAKQTESGATSASKSSTFKLSGETEAGLEKLGRRSDRR